MKTITQVAERRQAPRFKVKGMVIAVVHPPSLPPGSIDEISQNGLVFTYRENGNKWMTPNELDIIWADYIATYHLEKIPVRIVSDVLVEPQGAANESATRRQAVAFENINLHQENQIGRLIEQRGDYH